MVVRFLLGVDDASGLSGELSQLLTSVDSAVVLQIAKLAVGLLAQDVSAEDMPDAFDAIAAQHSVPVKFVRGAFRVLVMMFQGALKNNVAPDALAEDVTELGCDAETADALRQMWRDNLLDVSRSVLGSTVAVNQLADIQWRFGVTAASSELAQVGTTYLQLNLVLGSGDRTENVCMELSLAQFYQFVHEMEKVNNLLELLS